MNRPIGFLLLFVCLFAGSLAATRTLTILGSKKMTFQFQGGMPLPQESRGVKTEVTGFMTEEGKIIPALGFSYWGTSKVRYVAIDEVSGSEPVHIVEDAEPKLDQKFWKGRGAPRALNRTESAWIFERGDTLVVYRFTVRLDDGKSDVVIYQPAVFPEGTKKILRKLTDEKKG